VMELLAHEDAQRYANVGRNDPCPCGSANKFKRCHGRTPDLGPAQTAP
jgi:uncharacterized protein YecA (UPF0149 family)